MKNFSYTKSPLLIKKLTQAEELHAKIVLMPIPVLVQQQVRFDTGVERLFYLQRLQENPAISREYIVKLLNPVGTKHVSAEERLLIIYKKLLDDVYLHTFAQRMTISAESIIDSASKLIDDSRSKLKHINKTATEHNLQYIQTNADHPFIQAALAQLLILSDSEYTGIEMPLSFIIMYQFLFNQGYDFRKMMVFEQLFFRQKNTFSQKLLYSLKNDTVTDWINFILDMLIEGSEKLLESLSSMYLKDEPSMLSDRQQKILSLTDKPQSIVTNKLVQTFFKVSPITAARDLARLTQLGLIYPVGKGRSTGYKQI